MINLFEAAHGSLENISKDLDVVKSNEAWTSAFALIKAAELASKEQDAIANTDPLRASGRKAAYKNAHEIS